jgi:restriction system protein
MVGVLLMLGALARVLYKKATKERWMRLIGAFARVLYKRATEKKCIRCGNFTDANGAYCSTCSAAMSEAARRAAEQREAEQRARVEEQRRAREAQEEEERRRVTTLAGLHRLTGPQFEELIASLFRKDGYSVRQCGGTGDEGIDLVLVTGQEKDVVQCKRWKNDIGSPIVREFYGALMHANARHGFIITTASFSQSARDFAKGKPISLVSGAEILRWINGAYSSRDQRTSRRNANTNSRAFDPYAVLGLSRGASLEEIRAAYLREMVNYHPDKVAHLGKELQELAKVKAQDINRAYEEFARSR